MQYTATLPRGFTLVLVPVYKTLGLMLYLLHTAGADNHFTPIVSHNLHQPFRYGWTIFVAQELRADSLIVLLTLSDLQIAAIMKMWPWSVCQVRSRWVYTNSAFSIIAKLLQNPRVHRCIESSIISQEQTAAQRSLGWEGLLHMAGSPHRIIMYICIYMHVGVNSLMFRIKAANTCSYVVSYKM